MGIIFITELVVSFVLVFKMGTNSSLVYYTISTLKKKSKMNINRMNV